MVSGERIGPYTIIELLGEGGMGQVYRATDTNLKRQVAIKVLPVSVAGDAERLARFQREAEVLAAVNHPNIAAIYGLEKSEGATALVMELVEGDDLSQRIAGGAIPVDEALPIAKQIAEALEAAHEQGIIHRDLKPANIKVRPDGTVKVLDFGLAKALDPAAAPNPEAMNSPTITSPAMTQAGMILGTAAYMSPEQARGTAVDKRADVWAFGVVLFEMLTGQRLFAGGTMSDTLAAVLKAEPDWTALPTGTPPSVRKLLRRCLEKGRKRRLDSAAAARLEIDDALTAPTNADGATTSGASATTPSPRGRLPWMVATATAIVGMTALALPAVRHLREVPPLAAPEMRVEITTPATDAPLSFAISPNGRFLVFVASADGPSRLWLRPLDETEARPLPGTEGATAPFWSPDSQSVGFFAAGRLLRLDVDGGAPHVLATTQGSGFGGSWSVDGTIVFPRAGSAGTGPLWRVAATGGEPVVVAGLDPPRQTGRRAPHFLPDGRQLLFYAEGPPETEGIYIGSLDGGTPTRLTAADSAGVFLPPDRVVFVQAGTLLARRLDLVSRRLTGDPMPLADRIGVDSLAVGAFAVSAAGPIAYRAGGNAARQLTWFDRTGKAEGVAGEPDATMRNAELSPDGRRVAVQRTVLGNSDIWLQDLLRGGLTRLTFDATTDINPVWSPDGTRVAFSSVRTDVVDLYVKPSNGSGTEERLVKSSHSNVAQAWSPDGRWLVYYEVNPTTGRDLWALDMTDGRAPRVFANTPAEEVLAQVSPDGRLVAYQTNESGRFEVVVRPFPDGAGKWQVSTGGGVSPRWRADGRELYFLAPDAMLMAVPVSAAGPSFEAGTPVALFPTRAVDGGTLGQSRPQYAVARNGRFLINQPVADATAAPITLVLNWNPDAKK